MTLSQDDELLLNAYLDGELDPLEARSFEARLASEPALAGEIEAYRLLRSALRSDLPEDEPSPGLKRRIMSSPALRPPRHIPAWGSLARILPRRRSPRRIDNPGRATSASGR
jgi:anti-sigma factor RsiW